MIVGPLAWGFCSADLGQSPRIGVSNKSLDNNYTAGWDCTYCKVVPLHINSQRCCFRIRDKHGAY